MGTGISPSRVSTTVNVNRRLSLYENPLRLQHLFEQSCITTPFYITFFKKNNKPTRPISISLLNSLPNLYMIPIKPVVYGRSYLRRESNLILEQVSHLDAFSGYLFLAWLPSSATGMTTG